MISVLPFENCHLDVASSQQLSQLIQYSRTCGS